MVEDQKQPVGGTNLQADLYTVHLNNMILSFNPSKTADTRPEPIALTTEELEQANAGPLLTESAFGPYEGEAQLSF